PDAAYAGNGHLFVGALAIDPTTPSTLYVANGRIFKSTDGGQSWNLIKPAPCACLDDKSASLTIDPANPSTIYAGSFAADVAEEEFPAGGTISKSTDGGATWTANANGIPSDAVVRSLIVDPAAPGIVYASFVNDGWGILKSVDAGQSWSVVDTGLP